VIRTIQINSDSAHPLALNAATASLTPSACPQAVAAPNSLPECVESRQHGVELAQPPQDRLPFHRFSKSSACPPRAGNSPASASSLADTSRRGAGAGISFGFTHGF
jgi:hypothetical protein